MAFLFFFDFGPAGAPPPTVPLTVGYFKRAVRADWEKMALNSISEACSSTYFIISYTWASSLSFKMGSSCPEDERRQMSRRTLGPAMISMAKNSHSPWAKKNLSFQCLLLEYSDRRINLVFWQPWKLKVNSDLGFLDGLYILKNSLTESSCPSPRILGQRITQAKKVH